MNNNINTISDKLKGGCHLNKHLNHFYFDRFGDGFLLTNIFKNFIVLSTKDFEQFIYGELSELPQYDELQKKRFILNLSDEKELNAASFELRETMQPLFIGTTLHIFVVTLSCNQNCIYCQADATHVKSENTNMSKEVAQKAITIMMSSPASFITVEFQGGEPLLNFDTVKFIIHEVEKQAPKNGKKYEFVLVTNTIAMTDYIVEFLIDHDVQICISLDGPDFIHNINRPLKNLFGTSFQIVNKWIAKIQNIYSIRNISSFKLNVVPTITKYSLAYPIEIVDFFVSLGVSLLNLRFLSPFGKAHTNQDIIYSPLNFIEFYATAFNRIIEHSKNGKMIADAFTRMFVQKAIAHIPVNHMESRSPCGAGIGQLAFNWNGDIYTCDEARMLANMGDNAFRIGNVFHTDYHMAISSKPVHLCAISSCLESHANCYSCVFSPYCGICPVYNYFIYGSLKGDMKNDYRCTIHRGMFSHLFRAILNPDIYPHIYNWTTI